MQQLVSFPKDRYVIVTGTSRGCSGVGKLGPIECHVNLASLESQNPCFLFQDCSDAAMRALQHKTALFGIYLHRLLPALCLDNSSLETYGSSPIFVNQMRCRLSQVDASVPWALLPKPGETIFKQFGGSCCGEAIMMNRHGSFQELL